MKQIPSGQQVATFALATNRRWTTQQGETQDATEFHEIVVWGKLAEIASQVLSKGKKAYIEGRLQTRSWDAPDGSKRQRTEIIAENLIALSPREGGSDYTPSSNMPSTQSKTTKAKSGASEGVQTAPEEGDIDLSDLPF
jgi:single-strand DNA-binding protein